MSFVDLRAFLRFLEGRGDLKRITAEVDPDQDVTIMQHHVLQASGPALLFENVKGSSYRLVSNLFGTRARVDAVFGCPPREFGEELAAAADRLMPPSLSSLWAARGTLRRALRARLKAVRTGPVLQHVDEPADLNRLPCLTCWPLDGGAFFTLPLVHTVDPVSGRGNVGIYRLQRFDASSTGMHWQIEKGGGFHFHQACQLEQPLAVSVFLGGAPALTLAAVAPLPEGVDERWLAAAILGRPLEVLPRPGTGHSVPAHSEFVLEGSVRKGDVRREGPFGDHLGHYSHSGDFPVFRVDRVLARRDAIYPATVVGKPPQEDFHIGVALQEFALPFLKLMRPAVCDLWAYPETGFHPLAVLSARERYPREALKHALGVLGEGQLSLSKVVIVVSPEIDVRNFAKVSDELWANLDCRDGLHLLAPTAQDTLDFTGPAPNTGSRLILLATRRPEGALRTPEGGATPDPADFGGVVSGIRRLGRAVLVLRLTAGADPARIRAVLDAHPAASDCLFRVLVSADVPLDDTMLALWGWFTRFDPLKDLHPRHREADGNRVILRFPITVDATWKEGYRQPVAFDPDREKRVLENWSRYGMP